MTATRRWRGPRRLHVRAALAAAPLLLVLGAAMVLLLAHYSAKAALEASQRMNLGLARYVAEHQPSSLLDGQGRPDHQRMKALAQHVMMINPAVELYVLDAQGRVMAHALDVGERDGAVPVGVEVDMAPMARLLRAAASEADVRLPVFGTDPRQPGRKNIFTVAAVQGPGGKMGYLYIVLNGRAAQGVAATLANSDALRAMAWGAALATALAAAVLGLVWLWLTRPLRRLTAEVHAFRGAGEAVAAGAAGAAGAGEAPVPPGGDEIALLRGAVEAMRSRIAEQFRHLEDADRQRRELISNVSHDLRTPLANIQGYVETALMRAGSLDADARAHYLRTALRHVELLGRRVADLFELSKLDAGRMQPQQEVFCLAELLQDVVQNYRLAAQRRGVAMRLAAGSHLRTKVLADIAMIERVLQNLVDNALRHTAAGGAVELALHDCGAFLQISVSDTGRGIAAHHLPHIFERYWRAPAAVAAGGVAAAGEAAEGTAATSSGLGLAIVKRILELHGSAVRVHSELARGTRFEFQLPQAA